MAEKQLEGKVILVAGGSSGIGAAIAERCALSGARVVIGYASGGDRARALEAKLATAGAAVRALRLDVADSASISQAVAGILAQEGRIDGLVNSAGIHVAGPLTSLSAEEIERQVAVNLIGAIQLTQAVLQPMVRQRSGSIVQIGSVSAHRVARGHSVYSATKAGLEGFTRALASEVAKRAIRVNCLIPGPVLTPMLQHTIEQTGDQPAERVPLGRMIGADEVAQAALYLLSDRSSGITGISMPVDGGYLLW